MSFIQFLAAISEDEAREELAREEAAAQRERGMPALHSTSASSFIAMGFELEESQYVLLLFSLIHTQQIN